MSLGVTAGKLDVALVQAFLHWERPADNRDHLDALLDQARPADLVVLPEMFPTGFSMASKRLAEPMDGATVHWARAAARRLDAVLCGSVIIADRDRVHNRLLWVTPEGDVRYYDKRHLFRMSEEHRNYDPGSQRELFEINGIRVLPLVCYDIRFPVFCRNRNDYDVIVCVANWPAARREHWRTLTRARAIENQACMVAVNRVGRDGNGIDYAGDSAAIDHNGRVLVDVGADEAVARVRLDLAGQRADRDAFPVWRDADAFALISDAGTGRTDPDRQD